MRGRRRFATPLDTTGKMFNRINNIYQKRFFADQDGVEMVPKQEPEEGLLFYIAKLTKTCFRGSLRDWTVAKGVLADVAGREVKVLVGVSVLGLTQI